jgi:hypothetical protein
MKDMLSKRTGMVKTVDKAVSVSKGCRKLILRQAQDDGAFYPQPFAAAMFNTRTQVGDKVEMPE